MTTSICRWRRCLSSVALLAMAGMIGGCASTPSVRVVRDESADFSAYTSYRWLPDDRGSDRPRSERERQLSASVVRQVRQALFARGLRHRAEGADLGIGVSLTIRHEQQVFTRATALETLSSLHDSPSYEIQGTLTEVVDYERGRLSVRVVDLRSEREVWRGEFEGRYRGEFTPHLRDAIARTLAQLPSAGQGADTSYARLDAAAPR